MSSTPLAPSLAPDRRRVRQQARDVAVLMAFSAGTSLAIAVAMVLLMDVGR